MYCPYCRKPMRRGRIRGTGAVSFYWIPEERSAERKRYKTPCLPLGTVMEVADLQLASIRDCFLCVGCGKIIADVGTADLDSFLESEE
ncbi:MAG: PF20097 family protein [Butyricicoccaceae bacterium]